VDIINKLKSSEPVFSLEFFPPRRDMPLSTVYDSIDALSAYDPAFVSVTYGAGGSSRGRTVDIVSHVKQHAKTEAIAHLTCVGATPEQIDSVLGELDAGGVKNILALRGDLPDGMSRAEAYTHFAFANDLISHIKQKGGYTVAAAAYPEGHVENDTFKESLAYTRRKADAGADFFITQLCFDSEAINRFFEQLYKAGIFVPVLVGIMPVLNPDQIVKMSLLSACSIPAGLSKLICRYGKNPDDFKKAGLEYAVKQIDYLQRNSINKFHLYTMNKTEATAQIIRDSGLG